jgi:hypothetical protein
MSKRKSEQEVVDVFADLFNQTVDVQHHMPKEGAPRDEKFTKRQMPKVEDWYPIYADRPNSYQADLMFEPYVNSKKETILQAILCVININTKYAFAQVVDYYKKSTDNEDWKKKASRLRLTNKDAPLVLRSFKRIEKDMVEEARVLNNIPAYRNSVQFKIDTLYVDEGGEFMGDFARYCDSKNIHIHVFRNVEFDGLKRRLGIVERFNRTLRGLLEAEKERLGKQPFKNLLPICLAKYNRHNNQRSVSDYFRRDNVRGKLFRPRKYQRTADGTMKPMKNPVRLFPALMLMPGYEHQYMDMKKKQTQYVDRVYATKKAELQPGTVVRYYKRKKGGFEKERGSTMSDPHTIKSVHRYAYKKGDVRTGSSYQLDGVVSRFMPYELEVVNSKTPKIRNQETIRRSSQKKNNLLLI